MEPCGTPDKIFNFHIKTTTAVLQTCCWQDDSLKSDSMIKQIRRFLGKVCKPFFFQLTAAEFEFFSRNGAFPD